MDQDVIEEEDDSDDEVSFDFDNTLEEEDEPKSKPKKRKKRPWWDHLMFIPMYDDDGESIWEMKTNEGVTK